MRESYLLMTTHFLFISVDYVAKYAGNRVFLEEKHFFRCFRKTEGLSKGSCIVFGDVVYLLYDSFYVNIVSDTLCLQIFFQFLFQEIGSSSSRDEDVFQEELFGNVGCSDENSIE